MPMTLPYAMGEMPGAPRTLCWHSALTQGHSSPVSPWAQPWEGTDLRGHRPTLAGLSKERDRGTEALPQPAWGSQDASYEILSSWAAGFDAQPPLPPLPLSPGAFLLNKRVLLKWLFCTEKGLFLGGKNQSSECKCQDQSQVALFECKQWFISGNFQLETSRALKGW